jgi:hypothetical protein
MTGHPQLTDRANRSVRNDRRCTLGQWFIRPEYRRHHRVRVAAWRGMATKTDLRRTSRLTPAVAISAVLDVVNHSQTTLHHSIGGANS